MVDIYTFRAIAPVYSPLALRLGVDQFALGYIDSLNALKRRYEAAESELAAVVPGRFLHIGGQHNAQRQYVSTDKNSSDLRLMCWAPEPDAGVLFHVFANIAIVELDVHIDVTQLQALEQSDDAMIELIERQVQSQAEASIHGYFDAFCAALTHLSPFLSNSFVLDEPANGYAPRVSWVARTLLTQTENLTQALTQSILSAWLKKTSRPEDAQRILAGEIHYSMTWLNYVVNNAQPVGNDKHIHMMVLAQYFYVSQEHCNDALRGAIEQAYAEDKTHRVDKLLANTRTACRLNQIIYFENIKYLNRPNRALLEDILSGWKFDQLVENSERMVQVCNARLEEEDHKKRERSTVMTDFLLVALSFFAVFELSLYLTEFSREMMSRPALDYNDSQRSLFLGLIAEVDADIMFSIGFGLTLLLILVYRHIKRN